MKPGFLLGPINSASAAARRSTVAGISRTASGGTTTAPWRSAWMIVARAHDHAGDGHRDRPLDAVDEGVRRPDGAGEHLKSFGAHVEVADRAVGDHAQRAKALVEVRVDLAPPGAVAGAGIEILDHRDRGMGRLGHVAVIAQSRFPRGLIVASGRMQCANRRRARIADDGRKLGPRTHQRLGRVAESLAVRRQRLECVANGRRVEGAQGLEILDIQDPPSPVRTAVT